MQKPHFTHRKLQTLFLHDFVANEIVLEKDYVLSCNHVMCYVISTIGVVDISNVRTSLISTIPNVDITYA